MQEEEMYRIENIIRMTNFRIHLVNTVKTKICIIEVYLLKYNFKSYLIYK